MVIDKKNKTVTLEDQVNLDKLFDELKEEIPEAQWKKYTIVPALLNDFGRVNPRAFCKVR